MYNMLHLKNFIKKISGKTLLKRKRIQYVFFFLMQHDISDFTDFNLE